MLWPKSPASPPLEIARITITMTIEEQGGQRVDVELDDEDVPYITALGMLSASREIVNDIYGIYRYTDGDE